MPPSFQDIFEEARLSAQALWDYGDGLFNPTVRLGVTGLSRAGKTVFITALIHGLTRGGRFPVFEPYASGRIARARLEPQPDDAVPRFDYENHLRTLVSERLWPSSTTDISELRLVIDYQRRNGADRSGPSSLHRSGRNVSHSHRFGSGADALTAQTPRPARRIRAPVRAPHGRTLGAS